MPITRPRMVSSLARSITATSGVRQMLCMKPAKNTKTRPAAMAVVWPNARIAANHAALPTSIARAALSGSRLAPTRSELSSAPVEKSAPAASGKLGTLRLNTRPWSQVIVDGRMVGNTPQPNLQLSAGKHKLQLINQQLGLNKSVTVTIKAGEINTQVLNLAE